MERALKHAVPILPDRVYYVALTSNPNVGAAVGQRHFFSIDNEMIYWNFYLDFGPLNLGHVYRFCLLMNAKLKDPKLQDKIIYFYSAEHPHKRTNAVFLITAWLMLCKGKTPEEAFAPFKGYYLAFPPWHDATPTVCHFNLTILDTLRGLYKAREHRFFDFNNFDVEEYEHYEQVENGDLNWCLEGRFVMFAGPHAERQCSPGGYYNLRPEDYVSYFKRRNVTLVVRLNKPYYDAKKFASQGIEHMELYFIDGSNPPDPILNKFITKCEETVGAIAVHCKAGLGRTGTCIGCYMMKHYRLTAEETIGWLRIVRPGSIIGPQQQFMKDMQMRMWREGDLMRARLHQPSLENATPPPGSASGSRAGAATGSGLAVDTTAGRAESASNGKAVPSAAPSPSSIASRFSGGNIAASATGSGTASGVSTPGAAAAAGAPPTTPNSLSRRLNRLSLGGSAVATPPVATASSIAAANANSAKAEREGRETQGDLLRMRRAQAMSNQSTPTGASQSHTSSPLPSSPGGALRSPHGSANAMTPTSRTYGAHHSWSSGSGVTTRPDSRSGASISSANSFGSPKPDAGVSPKSAGTRSSIGNFLGFSK